MTSTKQILSAKTNAAFRAAGSGRDIVFFDGVCNLCNGWVKFIAKRDPKGRFLFAPLQWEEVREALSQGEPRDLEETIVLWHDNRLYFRSTAVLKITKGLRWPWPACTVLLLVPRPVRDAVYDFVARHRFRWFGRRDACMVPSRGMRRRFVSRLIPS